VRAIVPEPAPAAARLAAGAAQSALENFDEHGAQDLDSAAAARGPRTVMFFAVALPGVTSEPYPDVIHMAIV
jgi:hypothetical protein